MKYKQPRGIDKKFCELLSRTGREKIKFPKRRSIQLNNQFFEKYAEEIFKIPYSFYKYTLNNVEKLGLKYNKLPIELQLLHRDNYLIAKTYAMESFIIELQRYCFWMGQFPQRYSLIFDLPRAVEAEFVKFLGIKGKDFYRDHTLHKGNTFLYGLWLYSQSNFIQKTHKKMLENNPSSPGCIAIIGPNYDLKWQFFQQWFITASHHDVGRILGLDTALREAKLIVNRINKDQKKILSIIERKLHQKIDHKPVELNLDRYKSKINLDIAPLYDIHYERIAESHIKDIFWNECLEEIERLGGNSSLDHGINSAKILLKLANFTVKIDEIKKLRPWKRYSFRNYILPSLAIAKHNLKIDKNLIKESKINGLEFKIEKKKFNKEDFLTTLLICCDCLAEFERIGFKKNINLGMDFNLKLSEDKRNIIISLIRL